MQCTVSLFCLICRRQFDLDTNGILSVSARDKGTGKQTDIRITGASTLSEKEVKAATEAAEANAEADKRKRAVVDARNEAEAALYQADKTLKEFKDKMPPGVAERVASAESDLHATLSSDNADTIRSAIKRLTDAVVEIGSSVYGSGGGGPGGGAGPGAAAGGGSFGGGGGGAQGPQGGGGPAGNAPPVVDADFKEL